jgi:tripartite ATP-independent transporter DctP family solute receptor
VIQFDRKPLWQRRLRRSTRAIGKPENRQRTGEAEPPLTTEGMESMSRLAMTRRGFVQSAGAALAVTALVRPAKAETVLRWGTVMAPNHPMAMMIERIAKEVRERSGGAVEIQSFPGGQLGSSRDLIEATSTGAIDMVDEGGAQFGQFVPQMSIIEAPYLWHDPAHMIRALSSPLMDEFNKTLIETRGMRVIGATYYGTRHLTSGSRPIHTVDDLKGFKLRIPEVDTFRTMAEAWGARPTPLNIGELYLALSQGVVDGQENPLPTILSTKINEVQKYLVLTAHVMTPRPVAINEKTWQSLQPAARDILATAVKTHGAWQDQEIIRQEATLVGTFRDGGMTVVEPDVESFRKPVVPAILGKFEGKWGKGLWERIAAL